MSLSAVRSVVGTPGPTEGRESGGAFDSLDFRRTLGRFATGVTVVTMVAPDGEAYGITINAFMSVSLDPPLIAVSLDRSARAYETMAASERFAVSVLGEHQMAVSDRFAGRPVLHDPEPFEEFAGFPVVPGAIAHIVCRMHASFEAGDHTIFVGRVEALRTAPGDPLIFERGRYTQLEDHKVRIH